LRAGSLTSRRLKKNSGYKTEAGSQERKIALSLKKKIKPKRLSPSLSRRPEHQKTKRNYTIKTLIYF